ncbi:arginine N-methyltransferase [Olea europaea subsp. europaea]|uniref:Arginine N-methyltransferase n=1 Tax=Olea europaea subsp. europaea TaxID=158383 RepID=A0A8S0TVG5_OLEEU|nr:arginine N-methyltransferase [Olea europaea subsp. europaea]
MKLLIVSGVGEAEADGEGPEASWLVKDGFVLPDMASLHLTAIEDADYKEDEIEFWNNVYEFDMSCIRKQALSEPLVDIVEQKQIVTNCQLLKTMDISKMAPEDASFTTPFKLVAERDDYIHALLVYFDVSFTKCHKLMGFSTGLLFCPCLYLLFLAFLGILVALNLSRDMIKTGSNHALINDFKD